MNPKEVVNNLVEQTAQYLYEKSRGFQYGNRKLTDMDIGIQQDFTEQAKHVLSLNPNLALKVEEPPLTDWRAVTYTVKVIPLAPYLKQEEK